MKLDKIALLVALPALVAVALTAACASSPADDARPPAPRDEVEAPRAGAEVVLLDAGSAPRARLRYAPRAPARPFQLVAQGGIYLMRGVLQGEASYLPPIVTGWDPVPSAEPGGCARWRLARAHVMPDEKAGGDVARETGDVVAKLVGREVVTCVGARGELGLDLPAPGEPRERLVLDVLRQAFELEFTTPLPDEAVGKGARWTVRRTLPLAVDRRIVHDATCELVDVAEKGWEVAVTATFSAEAHPLDPIAGLAAGNERVVVDQVGGSGHGRIVSLKDELTPAQSDLTFEAFMSLTPSASAGAPTERERTKGHRLAYRARHMMQANALGPLRWEPEPARREE